MHDTFWQTQMVQRIIKQPQTILETRKQASIFIPVVEDRYISGDQKDKNKKQKIRENDHQKIHSLAGT